MPPAAQPPVLQPRVPARSSDADPAAPQAAIAFRHAETVADLQACHPVMLQLRPQLTCVESFIRAVERQRAQGYRLQMACADGAPVALASAPA